MNFGLKDIAIVLLKTGGIVGIALAFYFAITLSTFTLLFVIITLSVLAVSAIIRKLDDRKYVLLDVIIGIALSFVISLILFVLKVTLVTPLAFNWTDIIVFTLVSVIVIFVFELIDKLKESL